MKVKDAISCSFKALSKHSTTAFIISGIIAGGATIYLACTGTLKAAKKIKDEEEVREYEEDKPLTTVDKVKIGWKNYIPAMATGAMSIGCFCAAAYGNEKLLKHTEILTAGYTASEIARKEFEEKTKEVIGEKNTKAIKDEIVQDRVNVDAKYAPAPTGCGPTLCYDYCGHRFFWGDINKLKQRFVPLNNALRDETFISLNRGYEILELDEVFCGDEYGWDANSVRQIDISESSGNAFGVSGVPDGTPYYMLAFDPMPSLDYYNLHG